MDMYDVECSAEWRDRMVCEEILDRIHKPVKRVLPYSAFVSSQFYDMLLEHIIPSIPTKKRVFHPGKDMFVHPIDSMLISPFPDDFMLADCVYVFYTNGNSKIFNFGGLIG